MIEAKSPGWGKAMAANLKATNNDGEATLTRMGNGISGQLQQSIRDLTSPPLAKSTILARASGSKRGDVSPTIAKPLVDTGHMLGSVDFEVVKK